MNVLQRVVLIAGCCGILHSSIAPPVNQPLDTKVSRYDVFSERSLPFTRTYAVDYANVPGLLAEWGVIIAATGALYALLACNGGPNRVPVPPGPSLQPGEGPPPGISRT